MWSINSLNSRWMRTIGSRCAGERHAKVLLSVSRWQTYVRFPWESVGVFGQSVYTSLTRYEDEVIIKIILEHFIWSSTMGIIIVGIWCIISLITNWSDLKFRLSNNSVGAKGHKNTKDKVRIVIIFSVWAFTSRALRAYRHTHTHHIFYLKIGTGTGTS